MKLSFLSVCLAVGFVSSCAVAAKTDDKSVVGRTDKQEKAQSVSNETKNSVGKSRIKFAENSPADAIRVFYKNLREKRFREALMMTNLRPAIENLSDADIEDLRPDFEPLAAQVPTEIEINGEIVSNNFATVTAKMPNDETGALELKEFKLRRENDAWVVLTADAEAEKIVKKEGKNYFFTLRLEVHHVEAQNMLQRIAKAQMVHAIQNGGLYADMKTLVEQGLLASDAQSAESTGYHYNVTVSANRKSYSATAEPAVYGKTGKLSYTVEYNEKDKKTRLKSEDKKGAAMKK